MRKIRFGLFIVFMIGFLFPVGEAGAIFLLIAPGAAAQGTGEANVARVDDGYASYYNPASLAFQSKASIVGMHVNWLKTLVPDLYYEFIGFSQPGYGGAIGGHLIFLSLGEQLATDADGNELGNFKSYMWALDASYGTKLTSDSGIGLGFKLFHQKLADSVTENESGEGDPYSTDFAFDLAYLLVKPNFRFGFNIANIGPPIAFIDEDQADPAPTNMRIGFFSNLYKDEFIQFNMLMDMQKLLVASYPSMDWDGDRLIGDGQLVYDEDGDPIYDNMDNSSGQNEAAYSDPWYTAWVTAWMDDWYYGGDIDYSGDKYIGGYYWEDGRNGGAQDGQAQPEELYRDDDNGDGYITDLDNQGAYACSQECEVDPQSGVFIPGEGEVFLELGSGEGRKFSDEFNEIIINTGFEFWYTESFVLRAGYIYDKEGDITNPTFGAGVRFDGYGFDFGYTAGKQGHPRSNSLFFSISAEI